MSPRKAAAKKTAAKKATTRKRAAKKTTAVEATPNTGAAFPPVLEQKKGRSPRPAFDV